MAGSAQVPTEGFSLCCSLREWGVLILIENTGPCHQMAVLNPMEAACHSIFGGCGLNVWPAHASSGAGTGPGLCSHHALQVLFGQGLRRRLGLRLGQHVGVMVILKQFDHLHVIELYSIIQGNVAPPVRQAKRTRGEPVLHACPRWLEGRPPSL